MEFEVFDRADLARPDTSSPLACVDELGRLLFNAAACQFLAEQIPPSRPGEIALWFSAEERTAAVQAVGAESILPESQRWRLRQMRSTEWPRVAYAKPFVEHYRILMGHYPVKLLRGPGPRLLTFEVGQPAGPPPADIPGDQDVIPEGDALASSPVGG